MHETDGYALTGERMQETDAFANPGNGVAVPGSTTIGGGKQTASDLCFTR